VVLETSGPEVYVGRFDSQDDEGVHLIGVSVFDPASGGLTKADFLARTAKFGIKVDRAHLRVPNTLVLSIKRLADLVSAG